MASKKNGGTTAAMRALSVFVSRDELETAVEEAIDAGKKPSRVRKFVVNGGFFVMASSGKDALWRAARAKVPGIAFDELDAKGKSFKPTLDNVLAAIATLSDEERAEVIEAAKK